MTDPLSLDLVLSGRDLTEPRLSPDGQSVAFVHRSGSSAAISVVAADGSGPERILTFAAEPAPGRGLGGGCYDWLPSSTGVVFCGRDGELWEVDGAVGRRLTDHERSSRAPAVAGDGSFVVHVVDEAEVWLVARSDRRAIRLDDGRHAFCFDPAISPDGSMVSWVGWSPPSMPWDEAERVDARLVDDGPAVLTTWRPDDGAVQQPRFLADGTPVCVHDGSGWLNVSTSAGALVAEPVEHGGPAWGMGQRSYAVASDGTAVIGRNCDGVVGLTRVGPGGDVTDLDDGFIGSYGQVSMAGDRICALRSGPASPSEVVVIDGAGRLCVVVTSGVVGWDQIDTVSPQAVTVDGDGAVLHARRYPATASPRGLICWVHGGPTDQWTVDFRPRLDYWRSRGWQILVVDPRGTTGHGRHYQRALNGAWGRLDVDDVAAMIEHAHAAGWATPASTAVMGGSSGGLTVLGVLADHPGLVAGGVASYPVSDLAALATTTHRFEAHYTDTLVAPSEDPTHDERFRALSPLYRAERIAGPLLLFHGTEDPVVPIEQSDALVERVRAAGGTVDYVVYEGEGHGFRDPDHQRDEYARIERFLGSL